MTKIKKAFAVAIGGFVTGVLSSRIIKKILHKRGRTIANEMLLYADVDTMRLASKRVLDQLNGGKLVVRSQEELKEAIRFEAIAILEDV